MLSRTFDAIEGEKTKSAIAKEEVQYNNKENRKTRRDFVDDGEKKKNGYEMRSKFDSFFFFSGNQQEERYGTHVMQVFLYFIFSLRKFVVVVELFFF